MLQLMTKTLSPFSRSSPSLRQQQLRKKPRLGSPQCFCSRFGRSRPLSRNTRQGCEDVCTIFAEGLTFNAENQITQMDGGAAVYGYDGEGRRVKKTVGSEMTYYFYGVGGLLCEFTTTNTGATFGQFNRPHNIPDIRQARLGRAHHQCRRYRD